MDKLKLNVEVLSVESFQTDRTPRREEKGTVRAHMQTEQVKCTYFCTYACPTGFSC